MSLDASMFLSLELKQVLPEDFIPEITPVSMRDVDMMPCMDLTIHMSDPCPGCGAFRMQVGDYVCVGFCSGCTDYPDY